MKNFLLSSLLLIFSCTRVPHPAAPEKEVTLSADLLKSPFVNGLNSYFFKISSDIYGHYLSGLLIIKPVSDTGYRIVFTTEMGITLFDFEFIKDAFVVHYCMNKLNRKPVLKVLEKDFRLLLMLDVPGRKAFQNEKENQRVYSMKTGKEYHYYFVNSSRGIPEKIETTSSKGKKKVILEMVEYKNNFPHTITIKHQNIKLAVELDFIER